MSDAKNQDRPDLESARLGMKVQQGAPPVGGSAVLDEPDGTLMDKESPTGPPSPKAKKIPPHLKKIINFFQGLIADEGLLLEMCFDHCMTMVQDTVRSNSAGIDYFAGEGGGMGGSNAFSPGHYASVAGPMACELYRNVLKAIEGRADDYNQLLAEATREREKAAGKAPSGIIIP